MRLSLDRLDLDSFPRVSEDEARAVAGAAAEPAGSEASRLITACFGGYTVVNGQLVRDLIVDDYADSAPDA